MNRRIVLLAFALGFTAAANTSWAQEPNKVPVVGVLMAISTPDDPIVEAFRQGLRERGYVEGRNVRIEFRTAQGNPDRLPGLAEELVRLKVDAIFVVALSAIEAVRRATSTIPIVMAISGDPVASGLVKNISHPGGNITGLSTMQTDLSAKLLEMLNETVPRLNRVAVLWKPDSPLSPLQEKLEGNLKSAALALSIELVFVSAQRPEEFDTAFSVIGRSRARALYVIDNPLFYVHRKSLTRLAAKVGLPAIYRTRVFADAGGLMSYGASWLDQARQSAVFVDKILKGSKPGDLPIEQPTKIELVVNLQTAKVLGITIPQSILMRADEVIR